MLLCVCRFVPKPEQAFPPGRLVLGRVLHVDEAKMTVSLSTHLRSPFLSDFVSISSVVCV
jgi:hypothetical protein